jgi:hypothetical protein
MPVRVDCLFLDRRFEDTLSIQSENGIGVRFASPVNAMHIVTSQQGYTERTLVYEKNGRKVPN